MPKILEETNTKQKEQVENKDYSDYQIYLNKLLILLKNSPNESLSLECEKIWKWDKDTKILKIFHIYEFYLFYYSNVPKQFKSNNFDSLQKISPKAGVHFSHITISSILKNSFSESKRKFLVLEIPRNKIILFKKGKENPLFDNTKYDRILKFPFAVCPTNKVKWVLSTDPLKPNSEKTHQELFLIKLIEYWTQAFPTPNLFAPLILSMSFSNKLQNNFGQEYAIKNNIPQENAGLMIENKEPDNTEEEKEKEETNPNQEINNLFLSPEPSGHSLLLEATSDHEENRSKHENKDEINDIISNKPSKEKEKISIWKTITKIFSDSPKKVIQPLKNFQDISKERILDKNYIRNIPPIIQVAQKSEVSVSKVQFEFGKSSNFILEECINSQKKIDLKSKILIKSFGFNKTFINFNENLEEKNCDYENNNEIIIKELAEVTKKNLKSEKIKKSTKIFEQGDIYSSSQKKYWEDLFYNTLQENLNEQIENKQKINKSLQLVEILSEFNKFCQNIFENIVNDFNKLETERKFKPCLVKSDTLIYDLKDERIVIKLTGYGSKKRDDFLSNYKALGNEFRAYKFVLNRLMQNMKKNSKKIIFKVPLCCLIDYLGFRCLAYCKSNEIDGDKTLVLGFDSKNIYQRNNLLNENIIFSLADIFNIRKHFCKKSGEDSNIFETTIVSSVELHQKKNQKKYEGEFMKNYEFYLLNLSHILPDFLQKNDNKNKSNRLEKYRPEFIEEFLQRSHNPEWIISEPEKNEQNEALFFLQTYKENINNFVDDLEKNTTFFKCNQNEENFFERNIIESNRISDLLHRKGINIKSLSALFTKFSQPYLNNMTLNEMVIRICKKIVRFEFSKIISGISQNFDSSYLKQILFENLAAILNFLYDKKNKESQSFWNDCIWIQLESYFQIKISLEKKINYKFKLHSLIQLFESLGIEDKNKSFSLFKNLKKFTYLDFKETTIKSKIKSIDFIKFDCLKLFKSPITEENEPYQKRLFEIFGLANEFCLKKQLNYIKNGDYDIIINNISEELSYGIALNLKYSQLLFNIFLEKKDLQNALKTLDRVTEYDSFYFENLHPNYILSLMKLANFFMQEEFEEETVFLAKKIRRKFEKSIGEEACFYLNIYLKLLAIFDKFNCINEKIFCLEKICLFERENLEFFKDLICNYIKKGNKLQTRNTFRKFIGKINEKKMIILSKENINILLDLSSKFQNIKEENCSNECLKTIWICLQEIKIQKDYLPFILSEYFFKILQITIEGFSLETKEILKEFLGTLKEKKEKIKTCVDMILNISKKMTYSEFGEYFKNTLSKILLMQALDEKNKDEITMKAIFILVNLNFSNIQFF